MATNSDAHPPHELAVHMQYATAQTTRQRGRGRKYNKIDRYRIGVGTPATATDPANRVPPDTRILQRIKRHPVEKTVNRQSLQQGTKQYCPIAHEAPGRQSATALTPLSVLAGGRLTNKKGPWMPKQPMSLPKSVPTETTASNRPAWQQAYCDRSCRCRAASPKSACWRWHKDRFPELPQTAAPQTRARSNSDHACLRAARR